MRVTLSIMALFLGLFGAYTVGTGAFSGNTITLDSWNYLLRPFTDPNPISCLLLTVSVALAFFSLAIAAGNHGEAQPVQASQVFMWGGVFSVLTSAGFSFLLYLLWKDGAKSADIGLVFSLAAVQACLGMILGGAATIMEKNIRAVSVPVLAAGMFETSLAGVIMSFGYIF